jgi:O-acetyl-ADP-ribose deacetylase (regulator of RNase III)
MIERTSDYQLNNTTFRVTYGDLTKVAADALVSSDDSYLTMSGGVSKALLAAGGEVIKQDGRKHINLKAGDVVVTSAGYLPAKYIFHAVTLEHGNAIYPDETIIRKATLKSMQLADALGVYTVAFPALGTGLGGFPFQLAAEVMTRTIADYLLGDTYIQLVALTLLAAEGVKDSDLNLFYERVVGLSSISAQSKKLEAVLNEHRSIVEDAQKPELTRHYVELQSELTRAQSILTESSVTLENLTELQKRSGIAEISGQIVAFSEQTREIVKHLDREFEIKIQNIELEGLKTQLLTQVANLAQLQIDKANYGADFLVPLPLRNQIKDIERQIDEIKVLIEQKSYR